MSAVYQVNYNIGDASAMLMDYRNRIADLLYEDLFRVVTNLSMQKSNITATEINAVEGEKLLQLGPAVERLNDEFFDPLFDRLYNVLKRRGDLPEPPEELAGKDAEIEYISVVASAHKALNANKIERAVAFVANAQTIKPDVIDKIDMDSAVDEYFGALDVPPDMLSTEDEVEGVREERAAMQQQAADMERMKLITESAQNLANSPVNDENALGAMAGG